MHTNNTAQPSTKNLFLFSYSTYTIGYFPSRAPFVTINMDQSLSNYNYPPVTDLVFPSEWEPSENDQMLFGAAGDSFNITSLSPQTETTNNMVVLGQWPKEKMMIHQDEYFDDDQDMHDPTSVYHSQPLEELFSNALYLDSDGDYQNIDHLQGGFLDPLLNVDTTDLDDASSTASIGLPLEERYKATLQKLEASMKRSQETRNCLTMTTSATESYERIGSVKEIMSSIAASSGQVQKYVTSIKRPI